MVVDWKLIPAVVGFIGASGMCFMTADLARARRTAVLGTSTFSQNGEQGINCTPASPIPPLQTGDN
jgi:hypothetical protein